MNSGGTEIGMGDKNIIVCTQQVKGKRLESSWEMVDEKTGEKKQSGKICIDYSNDIKEVPDGILYASVIGCLLPFAVQYRADIRVPVCDKGFFKSMPAVRDAIWDVSVPEEKSRIRTALVQENCRETDVKAPAVIPFTDIPEDYYTLIMHADKKPDLVQVIEQDVLKENKEWGEYMNGQAKTTSVRVGSGNFRVRWSGVPDSSERALLMASLTAPLSWVRKKGHIFIPGKEGEKSLDGLRFGNMEVSSVGNNVSASEIRGSISDFSNRTGITFKAVNGGDVVSHRCFLFGTPDHGNLGDHQITVSTMDFLREIDPDIQFIEIPPSKYESVKETLLHEIKPEDALIFMGGGFFGNLWPRGELLRRDAFLTWPDNRKLMFPQSIWYTDDEEGRQFLAEDQAVYTGNNSILSFRDRVSFRLAKNWFSGKIILAPDIALYSDLSDKYRTERSGALLMMRNDKEKRTDDDDILAVKEILNGKGFPVTESDMCLPFGVSYGSRQLHLDWKLRQIAGSRVVVTDRLHGLILSAVTGTPCIAFGNCYHKTTAAAEWLDGVPYVRVIGNAAEFEKALKAVLSVKECRYPQELMREKYKGLQEAAREVLLG